MTEHRDTIRAMPDELAALIIVVALCAFVWLIWAFTHSTAGVVLFVGGLILVALIVRLGFGSSDS